MNYKIFFLFSSIIIFSSCAKINAPSCVVAKIKSFGSESCPKGANVEQYIFQTKSVYVFNPGNCGADMTSAVLDSNCTNLGFLGGIMGNTKIDGEDFSKAKLVKTTWKK